MEVKTKDLKFPTGMICKYRTRAIITRGLYLFHPIFHCGLYLREVYTAERLVISWIFFHLAKSPKKKKEK